MVELDCGAMWACGGCDRGGESCLLASLNACNASGEPTLGGCEDFHASGPLSGLLCAAGGLAAAWFAILVTESWRDDRTEKRSLRYIGRVVMLSLPAAGLRIVLLDGDLKRAICENEAPLRLLQKI